MSADFSNRVSFDHENEIMEVDFSEIEFLDGNHVNTIYDQIETLLKDSGRKWYFLVNYLRCQVDLSAVIAWQNRGKKLNHAYSLGSVRYQADASVTEELIRRAREDSHYANLVEDREQGLIRIRQLKAKAKRIKKQRAETEENQAKHRQWVALANARQIPDEAFESRIRFHDDIQTMEANFSDLDFVDNYVVDACYDVIDRLLAETHDRWYFLVNYSNCQIQPKAWMRFAARGKATNLKSSLGSVRFDASSETASEIERRANTESFDPNLFASRDEAVARIKQMRIKTRQA